MSWDWLMEQNFKPRNELSRPSDRRVLFVPLTVFISLARKLSEEACKMTLAASALLSASCLILSIHLVRRHSKGLRLLTLGSPWESFVWSFRVTFFKYSFPKKLEHWGASHASPEQIEDTWELLLRPFFESKGYVLYKQNARYADSFPCSAPSVAPASLRSYPYARTLDVDKKFGFIMGVSRIS